MKKVYTYICEYYERHGYAPTTVEIQQHFGFSSSATVAKYIRELIDRGYLMKLPRKHRGIAPLPTSPSEESVTTDIPLMGYVAAGVPIEKTTTFETIEVPISLLGNRKKVFALKVMGDSMIEDHIIDGDIVLVENRTTAHPGEICVVEVDGEVTLKRVRLGKDWIELIPSNPTMAPFKVPTADVIIHGVLVGLLRKY